MVEKILFDNYLIINLKILFIPYLLIMNERITVSTKLKRIEKIFSSWHHEKGRNFLTNNQRKKLMKD